MSDHQIGRVDVELSVDAVDLAGVVTDRTSRLLDRGLAATIERVCDEVSGGARLDRLDRLTLDLGRVSVDRFEVDLLRALEAALRRALLQALGAAAARPGDRVEASVELLEAYALTGNLPWWAPREVEATQADAPLHEAARALVDGEPDALVELIRDLVGDRRALARLAALVDLDDLAVILGRRWPGSGPALVPDLRRLSAAVDVHPAAGPRPRAILRAAILTAIGRPETTASSALHAILKTASGLGLDVAALARVELPPTLRRAVAQLVAASGRRGPPAVPPADRERGRFGDERDARSSTRADDVDDDVDDFDVDVDDDVDIDATRGLADAPPPRRSRERPPGLDDLDAASAALRVDDAAGLDGHARPAERGAEEPPSPADPRAERAPKTNPQAPRSRDAAADSRSLESSAASSTGQARSDRSKTPPPLTASAPRERHHDLAGQAAPASERHHPPERHHPRQPTPPDHRRRAARERVESRRRDALARLDELYLSDGGLVILWPFLARFFTRTGLLDEEDRFRDEPARAQAIALLSVLVRDDPEPPEPALPLAKLLCGASPGDPFDLDRPLDDDQRLECVRLLLAVIDHVPALGEIDVDDLRATFLRRPAVLAVIDGIWTLTVERLPQDLLLDRVPWSWRWFRLPWMADPLRVEW